MHCHCATPANSGQGGIRTPVVRSTSGLQPDAIGRSATCPLIPSIILRRCLAGTSLVCAFSMTIGTNQITFGYFGRQCPKGHPAMAVQLRDIEKFLLTLPVVKIHDIRRIVQPTISTRPIFGNLKSRPQFSLMTQGIRDVFVPVHQVMSPFVFLMTRPTVPLPPSLFPGIKFAHWFQQLTQPTPPHCQLFHVSTRQGSEAGGET